MLVHCNSEKILGTKFKVVNVKIIKVIIIIIIIIIIITIIIIIIIIIDALSSFAHKIPKIYFILEAIIEDVDVILFVNGRCHFYDS